MRAASKERRGAAICFCHRRLGSPNMLVYGFVSSKNKERKRRYLPAILREKKLNAFCNNSALGVEDRGARHHGTDRRTVCPRRQRRRQTFDRLLGSLGPERQLGDKVSRRGMGREGEGRSSDRLHPVAGRQEPHHHRGGSAGEIRP